ncbi:MAG: sulfite exporter TauE/SafE family protein [Oscillatoriales cyanobacterium C42_A2020_001]|nr:sulfite exporter TauE/SafE family protein [Leptolyngbyaceae cyanobacterium C42_A2020_001]
MTRFKWPQLPRSLPPRLTKKWLWLVGLFLGAALLTWGVDQFLRSGLYRAVEDLAFVTGETYDRWFTQQRLSNPLLLISFAFLGGLVASISPCILSLLPVNLSYIGTREIHSRRDAFIKAISFVFGVVTILSILGLFSSFAGFVFVQFRGYFHAGVGAVIVLMGLALAGYVKIPLPQQHWLQPPNPPSTETHPTWSNTLRSQCIGPYSVGLTFALVSSPCTSPVMVSVLTAAAATGSQLQSTLTMVSYALGYTAIIFLASLFTGLAKQTRGLLAHSDEIARFASIALLLVGTFYLVNGAQWIFSTLG